VTAEKVKRLHIGSGSPIPPPNAYPTEVPPQGSASKDEVVSKKQPADAGTREQSEYQRRLKMILQRIEALKKRLNFTHDQIQMASKGFKEQLAPGETIVITPSGGRYLRSPRNVTRPGVIHSTSPARSIVSKGGYNEIELERLTNELEKLFEQRDKLVREMKQKGFETSFIPY